MGALAITAALPATYAQTPRTGPAPGVDLGNGGSGVRCRGTLGLVLMDFWEAENLPPQRRIQRSSAPVDEQIEAMADRLESIWPDYAASFRLELARLRSIRQDLPRTMALPETYDLGFRPRGRTCSRQQVANYVPRTAAHPARLDISPVDLEALPNTDQAGLWVHEVVYSIDRFLGATTSEHAREVVGRLFAGETPTPQELVPAGEYPPVSLPGTRMVYLPGEVPTRAISRMLRVTLEGWFYRVRDDGRPIVNEEFPRTLSASNLSGNWRPAWELFVRSGHPVIDSVSSDVWEHGELMNIQEIHPGNSVRVTRLRTSEASVNHAFTNSQWRVSLQVHSLDLARNPVVVRKSYANGVFRIPTFIAAYRFPSYEFSTQTFGPNIDNGRERGLAQALFDRLLPRVLSGEASAYDVGARVASQVPGRGASYFFPCNLLDSRNQYLVCRGYDSDLKVYERIRP